MDDHSETDPTETADRVSETDPSDKEARVAEEADKNGDDLDEEALPGQPNAAAVQTAPPADEPKPHGLGTDPE